MQSNKFTPDISNKKETKWMNKVGMNGLSDLYLNYLFQNSIEHKFIN